MTTYISFIFTVKITVSLTRRIDFLDNPLQVVIDDFEFDASDHFTYEYNFFERWIHDISVEAIHKNPVLYKRPRYARNNSSG